MLFAWPVVMHAATITSTSSGGAWNTGGSWVGGSSPASTDDIVIASGATITTGGNRSCASMTINGTLTLSNGNNLTVTGNFTNNGTFNAGGTSSRVTFSGNNALQTVSGSATAFNNMTVNKGSSVNNILNITSVITMTSNGLTITNGTFKLSSASTITPFTGNPSLGSNAGLWNNGGTITTTNGNDFNLDGLFRNSAGTTNIGNVSGDYLRYGSGSSIIIEGGIVNIAGSLRPDNGGNSTTTYLQSGGTLNCATAGTTSGSTGVFDLSMSGCSFTMSGGSIVLVRPNTSFSGGDFLVLASTTNVTGGTIQVGNSNTPASQTIELNTTAPIYNLTVNATNSPVMRLLTNNLTVKNTLTIASGTTFNTNNLNMAIQGNWSNNGTYTAGTSTITFNGSGAQTVSGTNAFYAVTVNKTGGSLNLSNSVTISSQLSLSSGIVVGSASNQVIINNNATVSGASDSSHVNGAVKKVGNDAFVFPVGDGIFYAPISISAPANTNQEFIAQYFNTPYVNTSTLSALTKVSGKEHWILNRAVNTNNVNVTLSFSSTRGSGVNTSSLADLRVARWDGSQWVSHGNGGTSFSSPNGTVVTSSAVSSFSPFTLGSLNGLSVLPVEWLGIEAKVQKDRITIGWSTSSETNSRHFIVQKSLDGKQWLPVGQVKAMGNSAVPSAYTLEDMAPLAGVQYYRIQLVDLDGSSSFSPTTMAVVERDKNTATILYPNPANGYLNVDFSSDSGMPVMFVIYNAQGQKVITRDETGGGHVTIDISSYAPGLYYIEIQSAGIIEQLSFYKK